MSLRPAAIRHTGGSTLHIAKVPQAGIPWFFSEWPLRADTVLK